ncbi:MAG: type II secretion system protein [Candidatus Levybacteria bacterium]|nr:type II secretion system protein [Candidatus Levybacteria bacterium]
MRRGFTLIELLVVIAVMGVLGAIVLIAINPLDQIARGRDAGRKSNLSQLRHAVQSRYTVKNAVFVTADPTWITTLVNEGEIRNAPAVIEYITSGITPCQTNQQNYYCYQTDGFEAIIYVRLESGPEREKCMPDDPYFLWASAQSATGTVCWTSGSEPNQYGGYVFLP